MSRSKKYRTDRALRLAAERYFDSISRIRTVTEPRDTGARDKYGHPITEQVPVQNAMGAYMTEREYIIPPTVGGLCRYLGISRETWAQYCRNTIFAEATRWAKEELLAWREHELMSRPGKDLTGVLFDLQMNYGMSEKNGHASASQDDDPITKSLKEMQQNGTI